MLCFIVLTDLCLDAATTLFLIEHLTALFYPSGLHTSVYSKSFVIEVLHNNTVYRRFLDAGSFWEGERWVDAATPEFLFVNKTAAVFCLMKLFGFAPAHFWCEVTRCGHRTIIFDSTGCDVCHWACNISPSRENVSYCHHYVYLPFAFVLASRSTCFILTPILIQRCTEFVHWIITVLILM